MVRERYNETKEKVIPTPNWKKNGKLQQMLVNLFKDGHQKTFGIHTITLNSFIPNRENKPTIDHIDRNPENNKVSNLRYEEIGAHPSSCINFQLSRRLGTRLEHEILKMMTTKNSSQRAGLISSKIFWDYHLFQCRQNRNMD
jgi:hypothetical protein